jgi:hypothetical protein
MLPVSLYKQHWVHNAQKDDNQNKGTTQQTEGKVNNRESRDTGNIGHTTHTRTTIVACISGFSIIDFLFCLLCCSFALIVVLLCVQATLGTQNKIQTTIKAKEPQSKQKGKSIIENPEIQATLDTTGFSIIDVPFCLLCGSFALIVVCILCCVPNVACISGLFIMQTEGKVNNRESRDTVNIGHKTSEDKQNKNTIQKTEVAINNKQSRDTDNIGNVACISGLFIIDCPFCLLCCSFAFIVVLLCVVCPMLPVSLDCL